ncbi:MAG: Crp/Fnr family transcriptional regulator [Bacteroidota bacterium]|nr:Crp/Fnr family transcriptional regulator [Bacteroidota bacterium]
MFSNKLFKKYCSNEWLPIFDINKQTIHVRAKQRIFNEGDPVKGVYFIEQGKVKVLSKFNAKDEKIVRIAGNDTILGHRGIHYKHYHISAEALTETTLTFLPIDIFIKIIKANPNMAIYLLDFIIEELREAEERLKGLLIFDPKKRVALILIKLIDCFGYADKNSNLLSYTLSRADIANMAGTTYETIIRTLANFEKLKLIELVGKEIAIKNVTKLQEIVTDKISIKKAKAIK